MGKLSAASARVLSSCSFQVGFVKDQSVFRLIPTTGSISYDRDTGAYVPSVVSVAVTRSDGVDLEEDVTPSDYGLKIVRKLIFTDGTSGAESDVTSSPTFSFSSYTQSKTISKIEYTLRRTLGAGEAAVDSVTVDIRELAKDGEAATIFELFSTDATVHFDSDGNTTSKGVTVVPFRITGNTRTAIDVTSSNSEFVCYFSRTQNQVTVNRSVVACTSLSEAQVATLVYGRFDLLRRSDVTDVTAVSGGTGSVVRYDDKKVLASRVIVITKDGQGEPGGYTSLVFNRAVNQPAAPVGGTYSKPEPSPGREGDSAWSDAPLSGSDPLWMSRARILPSMTGATGAPKPDWSDPVLVTDSADVEVIWSALEEPSDPSNTHPYVADDTWGKSVANAIWMAVAVKSSGSWQPWKVQRIRGEGAVSIQVSPANVVAPGGKFTGMTYIKVRMYVGQKQVTPSAHSALFGSEEGIDPVSGINWQYYSGSDYVGYRIKPCTMLKQSVMCTPYLVYRGQNYPFAIQFTVAPQGIGKTGPFCPPPARWEDYPDEYRFLSGLGEDDTRCDCVIHGEDKVTGKFFQWKCKQSHNKSSEAEPYDGSPYWDMVVKQKIVASEVLLADRGYISLLSSQAVRIYDEQSRVTGQFCSPWSGQGQRFDLPFFIGGIMNPENGTFSNPTGPLMAIDENGKAYFGGTEGQRVEIDPGRKALQIYDAQGNLCAIHSGEQLDYNSIGNSVDNSSVTISKNQLNAQIPTLNGINMQYVSLRSSSVSKRATLKLEIPAFKMTVNRGQSSASSGGGAEQLTTYGHGTIQLALYVKSSLRRLVHLLTVEANALDSYTATEQSTASELEEQLEAGDNYEIALQISSRVGASGYVDTDALGGMTVSHIVPNYVAHYGANGFYISTNTLNYIYALFDSGGKLHFKVVSDGNTIV